jgi:uncharacterized protein (TIGR02186 family)
MRWDVAAIRSGLTIAALCLVGAGPVRADPARLLISDISDHRIEIGSGFAGTDILVFGAIAPGARTVDGAAPNQVAIVLRGESRTRTVRRKERVAGIWVNRRAQTFTQVPSVYLLATTEPLDAMADSPLFRHEEIGLANLPLPFVMSSEDDASDVPVFRAALVRQRMQAGLYHESEGSVSLIDGALFRGSLHLPATIVPGRYQIDVYLLRGGAIVARNALTLKVDRAGVERRVSRMAERRPVLYGLIAVLMSLSAGWIGTTILRGR